ncbi:MAG: hypothetical protein PVH61_35690 [Candidatus Aminicenantes bacterium]|jgi:hypothetical protein
MKKIFTTAFVVVILTGLLINTGCKQSEEVLEYILTVTLYDGVTGTPEAGTYTYNEVQEVEYNYSLLEGYTALSVLLDGEEVESSGTFTMDGNHYIVVTAGQGTGDYRLNVSVSVGASGTPEEGTYYYDAGEQVDYSYSLVDGYTNLRVSFDGVNIGSTGTITISQDHDLFVYTDKEYFIQGNWTLAEEYEDGSSFTVTVTFTGDIESGTVVDSDGGIGTYTVTGGSVYFILEYPEVIYEYTGDFSDEENMGGDAKRLYVNDNTFNNGVWAAVKDTN